MPKIIEHLEEQLVAEAGRQARFGGYSAVTIRSVAGACGVGVGTVYNYFPSKDALLAAYLLEDWKGCLDRIRRTGEQTPGSREVARCIHSQLVDFVRRHQDIFQDEEAAAGFAGAFRLYHGRLRTQLAAPLRPFCHDDFAAEFAAEGLLTWTMAGRPFDQIWTVMGRLFDEENQTDFNVKGENYHVQL